MKEFNDYRKGQHLLKLENIKIAKSYITKILSLCNKKGLDFSYSHDIGLVDVRNLKTDFVLNGYFSYDLVEYQNEESKCYTLPHLYEKLKAM